MKKIVTLLTLLLAFTISANAQESKDRIAEAAKKDAVAITEYLSLQSNEQENFVRLFEMKHEVLSDPNMSDDRKKEMSRVVGHKIRASLTDEQLKRLDSNPELMKQLQY